MKAAAVTTPMPAGGMSFVAAATAPSMAAAATPARVPSSETAPSVPGLTRRKVVIMYVVLPYAWPISLETVSARAVANVATSAKANIVAWGVAKIRNAQATPAVVLAIAFL